MKNKYIYIFGVLATIFSVLIIYFYQFDKKSDLVLIENPIDIIDSGTGVDLGTGSVLHLETSLDSISMETNFEKSTLVALEEYEKYEGKNLKNLIQLQRLYSDNNDYETSIKYGELGLNLAKENEIIKFDKDIYEELVVDLLKSLILNGNYIRANEIIDENENLDLNYEKALIKYKEGKYQESNIFIENSGQGNKDKNLILSSKNYEKLGEIKNSIDKLDVLLNFWEKNLSEDEKIKKNIYLYYTSMKLSELYLNLNNDNKQLEYKKYNQEIKKIIDNDKSINSDIIYLFVEQVSKL